MRSSVVADTVAFLRTILTVYKLAIMIGRYTDALMVKRKAQMSSVKKKMFVYVVATTKRERRRFHILLLHRNGVVQTLRHQHFFPGRRLFFHDGTDLPFSKFWFMPFLTNLLFSFPKKKKIFHSYFLPRKYEIWWILAG